MRVAERPTEAAAERAGPSAAGSGSGPLPGGARRLIRLPGIVSLLVGLAYGLITIFMTWPYVAQAADSMPPGEDPLLQVWIARWVQHALVTDPLNLYDANAFYPLPNTLAYSDSNVPAALLAAPIYLLTDNAILANNLLVLGSFVLAAGGVYALVGRLTGNRAAGFLAGLAYAFLPYRFSHLWHLNQLGHAWTPWVLVALLALVERRTWRAALTLGLLLAVQTLTSFYIAFQLAFALPIALSAACIANPRARTRRFFGRLAVSLAVAAALVLPLTLPYLAVRDEQGLQRTVREAERYQAYLHSYLKVERGNHVWGWLHRQRGGEDALFPGGVALAGAALALVGIRRRPAPTITLLLIAAVAFVISLGPTWRPDRGGTTPLPYRFLFEHFPFFKAMRVPARFGILTNFAVTTLAGLGLAWAWERLMSDERRATSDERRSERYRRQASTSGATGTEDRLRIIRRSSLVARRLLGPALTAILVALILFESHIGPMPLRPVDHSPEVTAAYNWLANQPNGVVMEFPAGNNRRDTEAMYRSTRHWKPLAQGYSGFVPRSHAELAAAFTGDLRRPNGATVKNVNHVNERNVGLLQQIGVRYVILHRYGYKRDDWSAVTARIEATGAVEKAGDFGEATIYLLREPAAALPPPTVALVAPSIAPPDRFWEPTVLVRNAGPHPALLSIAGPLTLTTTWRDDRGREVRRDTLALNLPAVVPPGDLSCSPRACPVPAGATLAAPGPGADGRLPRLNPPAPGRYSVELALTGGLALRRTLDVDVVAAEPAAAPNGPPLEYLGASTGAAALDSGQPLSATSSGPSAARPARGSRSSPS